MHVSLSIFSLQTQVFIYVRSLTPMSTYERLSRLDLGIHEVGHRKRIAVDRDVVSH
jgi:hypothetical protein